jgi:hypothetical protein
MTRFRTYVSLADPGNVAALGAELETDPSNPAFLYCPECGREVTR